MVLHPWLIVVNGTRIYRLISTDAAIAIFILAALAHLSPVKRPANRAQAPMMMHGS
jgi:hypothetical protein